MHSHSFYDKFALLRVGKLVGIPFVENLSLFLYEIIGNTMVTAILVLELGGGKFFLLEITPCQDLLHPCKGGNQFGNRTFTATLVTRKTVTSLYLSIHPLQMLFLSTDRSFNLDSTHMVVL